MLGQPVRGGACVGPSHQRGRALSRAALFVRTGRVSRDRPANICQHAALGLPAQRHARLDSSGADLSRQPVHSRHSQSSCTQLDRHSGRCQGTGQGRLRILARKSAGRTHLRRGDDRNLGAVGAGIAAAYDFGHWETLTDVGGGNGVLLAAILRAHPALQGVLADAPSVVERARRREFLSGELAVRARFEPCDFFHAIPSGSAPM